MEFVGGLVILQVALIALFPHRVRKILNLRVFEDESGKHWSKSVMDKQYEVLCVSQFTLQCVLKGNKPDFHLAMPTEQAESFYNSFLEQLRKSYRPELVRDGKFGAYMQVHIQNDGPVTIELESPAPGAANADPKQVSLKSGDCRGLLVPTEEVYGTVTSHHSDADLATWSRCCLISVLLILPPGQGDVSLR
ncbi:hypothetical protein U0070_025258 [Myodes glareolus]|uniref:D-aminoacyl-tRNA deacylase 1 n=1 Tax=Myodes glareolus TaxID=447135 RepID=A0AAW0IN02_MYOGA